MAYKGLVKEFFKDNLRVLIFDSEHSMGIADADMIETAINSLKKQTINMVFAPAVSQLYVFENLFKKQINFNNINGFHLDEYIGLPANASERIAIFAERYIFGRANFKNFFCMQPTENNIDDEIIRYTKLLKENPLDIGVIGIGQNGHIAYNEPHEADFNDKALVKRIRLDEFSINQAIDKDKIFASEKEIVYDAITMTIPAIMAAKQLFVAVPGKHKSTAVRKTLTCPISKQCPASILRTHPNAVLFLDQEAASEL